MPGLNTAFLLFWGRLHFLKLCAGDRCCTAGGKCALRGTRQGKPEPTAMECSQLVPARGINLSCALKKKKGKKAKEKKAPLYGVLYIVQQKSIYTSHQSKHSFITSCELIQTNRLSTCSVAQSAHLLPLNDTHAVVCLFLIFLHLVINSLFPS